MYEYKKQFLKKYFKNSVKTVYKLNKMSIQNHYGIRVVV